MLHLSANLAAVIPSEVPRVLALPAVFAGAGRSSRDLLLPFLVAENE
jgi:hypothetical protein